MACSPGPAGPRRAPAVARSSLTRSVPQPRLWWNVARLAWNTGAPRRCRHRPRAAMCRSWGLLPKARERTGSSPERVVLATRPPPGTRPAGLLRVLPHASPDGIANRQPQVTTSHSRLPCKTSKLRGAGIEAGMRGRCPMTREEMVRRNLDLLNEYHAGRVQRKVIKVVCVWPPSNGPGVIQRPPSAHTPSGPRPISAPPRLEEDKR
jgi:hypothetical protein